MNTFTIEDPTGDFTFKGDEQSAWDAFVSDVVAQVENMTWFDWCVQNLEQVTLYV